MKVKNISQITFMWAYFNKTLLNGIYYSEHIFIFISVDNQLYAIVKKDVIASGNSYNICIDSFSGKPPVNASLPVNARLIYLY